PETFLLNTPASPHAAARLDHVEINLENFIIPQTKNDLIIEGAGGCLVPLNEKDFVIDLAKKFEAEIILVSNLYLGSINHTLLSAVYLKSRYYRVKGIVFNGNSNPESENIILKHTQLPCLLRMGHEQQITKEVVAKHAREIKKNW
ncbi:MAG TPA: AAA family ATPase, partial [Cyclobacteriaceae bacterium]|nr:AAA family ATPase [Cyclobacteriaceae bacterium]